MHLKQEDRKPNTAEKDKIHAFVQIIMPALEEEFDITIVACGCVHCPDCGGFHGFAPTFFVEDFDSKKMFETIRKVLKSNHSNIEFPMLKAESKGEVSKVELFIQTAGCKLINTSNKLLN